MQDPLADGPTIQAAATRALLEQHVTLDQVLSGSASDVSCVKCHHIHLLIPHLTVCIEVCCIY